MRTDKKAIIFVVLLSIVTVGLAIAIIAYGWNYFSENVLDEDFFDSVKEWFADAEDDDDDRYADEEDDEDDDRYADEEDDEDDDKELASERQNTASPEERVYDYADVLTDEAEELLREYIAVYEEQKAMDIVIVIMNEDMESLMDMEWDEAMEEFAENFYDDNKFGYDEPYGDGVLLLDNWYDGQAGSWITTAGRLADEYSQDDLQLVFDVMFSQIEEDPFAAYSTFVYMMAEY